jgi:hypothetical protein
MAIIQAKAPSAQPYTPAFGVGHNSGLAPDAVREDFLARVRLFVAAADTHAGPAPLDAQAAQLARDWVAGAKKLAKEVGEARIEEKRAVDEAWRPIADRVGAALEAVNAKLEAFLKAERARQEEERRAAWEKARAAEEAARKAAAEVAAAASLSAKIEAEQTARAAAQNAAKLAIDADRRVEPAKIESATGAANAAGMRTVWSAVIVDPKAAALALADHPDIADAIRKIALAKLRSAPTVKGVKSIPDVAGVQFYSEQKLNA